MGKGLLFFCCSCCILVLTIINLSVGPIISKKVGQADPNNNNVEAWGTANCKAYKDSYDDNKGGMDDKQKKKAKSIITACERGKALHDMEYTAFIFDIVIGFVCGLIGLLHLFDLKKDFVSNTGLIGLICGVVGFVLTLVYVIYNGLVFNGRNSYVYERDGDGVFAEQISSGGTEYRCLNYDPETFFSGYAKFSELNKKQYNYKKDFYGDDANGCIDDDHTLISACRNNPTIDTNNYGSVTIANNCKNLYAEEIDTITNKDIFDRFLTALILSLIVCLANIGLALFGFLLFRTPGDF